MSSIHSHNQTGASLKAIAGLGLVAAVSLGWGVEGAIAQPSSQPIGSPSVSTPSTSPQTLAQASAPITGYFLFVNPTIGNDAGEGTQRSPLRTITRALQLAQPNSVIVLSAGTYSTETGETFPLALKPGVTLQGDSGSRGQGIIIRGGGEFISSTFARQNITLLGANQALVSGVTLTNPNPRGYGLWIESSSPTVVSNTFSGNSHDGISVTGQGAPLIQGNAFVQNGANGITIYGTTQPQVRENVFERTGFGINIAQRATPTIVGNRIVNNEDGIVVQGEARPVLRGNTIEGNERDGLVAIARSQPDLGTANEPGQNTFRNNGRYDLNTSAATQTIAAWGNELTSDRIHGSLNLAGQQLTGSSVANLSGARSSGVTRPAPALATARSTPPANSVMATVRSTPSTPTTAANTGFAALPRLQSTIVTPSQGTPLQVAPSQVTPSQPIAQPAPQGTTQGATQPTRPERLPLLTQARLNPARSPNSTETVAGSVFPTLDDSNTTPSTLGAIEIPVPPPQSSRSTLSLPSQPAAPRALRATNPTPSNPAPSNSALISSAPSSHVLPVPGGNVPLGNIGNLPTVVVSSNPLQRRRVGSPPPAPNRAEALGLRYRVVVEAEDETTQAIVRSLIPGAFRTQANGRIMMQAGAYSDRVNADEAVEWLISNGLRAIVQPLN